MDLKRLKVMYNNQKKRRGNILFCQPELKASIFNKPGFSGINFAANEMNQIEMNALHRIYKKKREWLHAYKLPRVGSVWMVFCIVGSVLLFLVFVPQKSVMPSSPAWSGGNLLGFTFLLSPKCKAININAHKTITYI